MIRMSFFSRWAPWAEYAGQAQADGTAEDPAVVSKGRAAVDAMPRWLEKALSDQEPVTQLFCSEKTAWRGEARNVGTLE